MKSSWNSGFSGKGFKFDETEAQLANERKKLQKAALGLQDSDDEDSGVDVSNCLIDRCPTSHLMENFFHYDITIKWSVK